VANVVITGGAGFIGARLARQLLAAGRLQVAGEVRQLDRLTLVDRFGQAGGQAGLAGHELVTELSGDVAQVLCQGGSGADALASADVIFHLAAAVSGECEADFDLGMRANLAATQSLLAACRALGTSPLLVFASSVAVFGGSPEHPLPEVVEDQTLPNPQSSYGVQKLICEQLLADYTRKGFLRGRAIRLMTVSVRPGRPNGAASGFLSGIIREPLAGQRATCPVGADTEVALASPAKAVEALLRAAGADDQAWGGRSPVTMPALTVKVADMVAALGRVAGPDVAARIDWVPDPLIIGLFRGWPGRVRSERAAALGLTPDQEFESVIRMHLAESGIAA
jgi:nucleoside-diphosphate-sugar epimerase